MKEILGKNIHSKLARASIGLAQERGNIDAEIIAIEALKIAESLDALLSLDRTILGEHLQVRGEVGLQMLGLMEFYQNKFQLALHKVSEMQPLIIQENKA